MTNIRVYMRLPTISKPSHSFENTTSDTLDTDTLGTQDTLEVKAHSEATYKQMSVWKNYYKENKLNTKIE